MNLKLRDYEAYCEADDKLQKFQLRERQLANDETEMARAISRPTSTQDEAAALLHDSPVDTVVVTRDQLAQCRHDRRVVTEAIAMQKRVVEKERGAASIMLCDQARPAYHAITKKMAAILAALRDAAMEEHNLRRDLIGAGASLTNEFINPFHDCGEPAADDRRNDSIDRWLREAKTAGAI